MCNIIVINKGEKEIGTPQQFLEHFGFEAEKEDDYDKVEMNSCLCQVDVEKTFNEKGIEFKRSWGDYYVGMLEEVDDDC